MGLVERVASRTHKPCGRLLIDNREVRGFRARIRFSYSAVVATCSLTLKARPSWLDFGQKVEVWLGYDGAMRQRFVGFVEDDGRKAWPHSRTIGCAGYMRRAERKNPSRVTYQNESARTIIADLLTRAGVPFVSIEGDDTTLGTLEDVVLARGDTYLSLIQQIDAPFLSKTYDCMPDGTVRRLTLTQLPAAAAKWVYTYPGNVLEIDNPTTSKEVKNRVEVTGLDGVTAYRRADSPYVAPGYDEVHEVRSDLIETADIAADVALLWMPTVNRLTRSISIRVAGNPMLDPGDTITLDADSLGIDSENLYLAELDDDFSESGYYSQLTLSGGKGEAGYAIYPPRAAFTVKVTEERFDAGSGLTTYYTVFCDGSGSSSPVGAALTFAWSNSQTADTATTFYYSFRLTEAEWAAGADITLTVSDGSESDEVTQSVTSSTSVIVRQIYITKHTDAEATPNGGVNWYTSTLDADATPPHAGASFSYFGVGAALYRTDDYLQTAPVLMHTFGSSIYSVSLSRNDEDHMAVGLGNGQVWRTTNANQKESAAWTLLGTRSSAVRHVVLGVSDMLVWSVAGRSAYQTNTAIWSLPTGYSAIRLALRPLDNLGHWLAGTNGSAGLAMRDDGFVPDWPEGYAPVSVQGFCFSPLWDNLYAADELGRFYRLLNAGALRGNPSAASRVLAWGYVATIGGGACLNLIADPTEPQILYASCANGFYKSYDAGLHWYLVRSGETYEAGIGSEPWGKVTAMTVASDAGDKCLSLWNGSANVSPPAAWRDLNYDDSDWSAAVVPSRVTWNPSGTTPIWTAAPPTALLDQALFRTTFTLSSGLVSKASLTLGVDDACDVWVNNTFVCSQASQVARPIGVPPAVLKAGGQNVIAILGRNISTSPSDNGAWVAYRLEVS